MGNLGQALANYRGFGARGFRIVALVDTDPEKIGRPVGELTVEALDDLPAITRERGIAIGMIAVPAQAAQEVADRLADAGIRSILNFAPTVVTAPDDVSLRKVDLAIELQILSFYQQRRTEPARHSGTEPGCVKTVPPISLFNPATFPPSVILSVPVPWRPTSRLPVLVQVEPLPLIVT